MVETPPAEDLYVSETYDTEEVLGALVNYTESKFDFLLWSRTEGAVTVNGEPVDTKIVNDILEVVAAEGETAIAVVVNEPELEPSEPTEPSEQPTEPEKNEDLEDSNAALWIIVAAAAVLLAGAAVGIVLFVKKRKVTNVAADEAAE